MSGCLKDEVIFYFKDFPKNTRDEVFNIINRCDDELSDIEIKDRFYIWNKITNDVYLKNKVDLAPSKKYNKNDDTESH